MERESSKDFYDKSRIRYNNRLATLDRLYEAGLITYESLQSSYAEAYNDHLGDYQTYVITHNAEQDAKQRSYQQQERGRGREVERGNGTQTGRVLKGISSVRGPGFSVSKGVSSVTIAGYENFLKFGGALGALGAAKALGIEDWFDWSK